MSITNKLYLVHLGYYDEISNGVYECHTNIFVAAKSFEDARAQAKELPMVKEKHMHVDGMQLIEAVKGYDVTLVYNAELKGEDKLTSDKFRELAPKKLPDMKDLKITI